MKKEMIIVFLSMTLMVSGCISLPFTGGGESNQFYSGNNTLFIDKIEFKKSSLLPRQETTLTMKVSNGNVHKASDFSAEIYNTGPFEVESLKECSFDLRSRLSMGEPDSRSCLWSVKAPKDEYLGRFKSKEVEIKLLASFNTKSSFEEVRPEIVFERGASPSKKTFTTDAGNLKAEIEFESPQPLFRGEIPIEITLKKAGKKAKDINIEYIGAFDFSDCPKSPKASDSEDIEISCKIKPLGDIRIREKRTILLRINYKYMISKGISLEVSKS